MAVVSPVCCDSLARPATADDLGRTAGPAVIVGGVLVAQIGGVHSIGQRHQDEHILHQTWHLAPLGRADPRRRLHHHLGRAACQPSLRRVRTGTHLNQPRGGG